LSYFVFLEFTSPGVRAVLTALRDALQSSRSTQPVHITVRGPYESLPDPELLQTLDAQLSGRGIRLRGGSYFQFGDRYAAVLRAESSVFRDIWWKRDFPEGTFGINPHLTVFETSDHAAARKVAKFLRSESIDIYTRGIALSVYTSKQDDLFRESIDPESLRPHPVGDIVNLRDGLIARARMLARQLASAGA
jgi:hypothetical protein